MTRWSQMACPLTAAVVALTACSGPSADGSAGTGSPPQGQSSEQVANDSPSSESADEASSDASDDDAVEAAPESPREITAAEAEACAAFGDTFEPIALGLEGVGLKDMASGRGGSVASGTNFHLSTLTVKAAEAALDQGELAPALSRFVRSPRSSATGFWPDTAAQTVGQLYVDVQLRCADLGARGAVDDPGDETWQAAYEWAVGAEPDGSWSPNLLCMTLADGDAIDVLDLGSGDASAAAITAMLGTSALNHCPEHTSEAVRAADLMYGAG